MRNLRIREEQTKILNAYYGNNIKTVYHVVKDLDNKFNYTEEAKQAGQIVATFNHKETAEQYVNMFKVLSPLVEKNK